MDDKRLKGLIDEVKAVGDAGKDMASSEEVKNLEAAIKEETQTLQKLAKGNDTKNNLQIGLDFLRAKITKSQQLKEDKERAQIVDQDRAAALKRDKGGKAAREIILEQNKLTLEGLNRIEKTLALISKQGGIGGAGLGGKPGPGPNKPDSQKTQAEKDLDQAAKNTKESTEKRKKKESAQGDLFAGTDSAPPEEFEKIKKERKKKTISAKDRKLAEQTTVGQGEGAAGTGEKLDTEKKRRGYGMDDEDYARQFERDQAALKRESRVKDIGNLTADVKTTGKSLNKRKISGQELSPNQDMFDRTQNLVFREDEQIRVGQTNYKRAGDYKTTGTAKFQNVDTGKFAVTDPIKALAEDVRISQGVVGTTRNRLQNQGSQGAAELNKNIGANAAAVQKALDANEDAKADLGDVIKALGAMQENKDPSKQNELRGQVTKNIERLKVTGGEDLAKMLNLEGVNKASAGKEGKVSSITKAFFGVNQGDPLQAQESQDRLFGTPDSKGFKGIFDKGNIGKDAEGKTGFAKAKAIGGGVFNRTLNQTIGRMNLSKNAMSQVFDSSRIFGDANTGKLSNFESLQGDLQFKEAAQRDLEVESQGEAQGRMMSSDTGLGVYDGSRDKGGKKLGPDGLPVFDPKKKEEWRDKNIPEENRDGSVRKASEENIADLEATAENTEATAEDIATLTKEATTEGSIFTHDTHLEEKFDELADAIKGKDERTGQDTESFAEKQLDTLEQMLESLQNIEAGGLGGGGEDSGGGMMDMIMNRGKKKGGKRGGKRGGKKRGGKLGKLGRLAGKAGGLLKGAARFAGPLAGIAAVGTAAYGAFNQFGKTDEFGVEGKDATGGMKAASAAGGALSALTLGLADADTISKGIYGKTGAQTLEALKEKDPELAARIEKRVAQGENLDDVINDEQANIKEAGVDDRGFFGKAFDASPFGMIKNAITDATTTTDLEAGMDQAKESGLYDEKLFGESTIDKEKLKDASISQLKAIIKDDDLTGEDMQLVKDTLEEKRNAKAEMVQKLESGTLDQASMNEAGINAEGNKTALAVENMGRLSGEAADMASAQPQPVVVNNNSTSAPASGKSDDKLIGVMGSPGIRNNDSTIHRAMDRRFT
tara:strand:- start:1975 stop:5301 length:3327 start_codon:yes stop_codon:yes gene_type:complete